VISEALTQAAETIGFRVDSSLDTTCETQTMTQVAVTRAKEGNSDALRFLYVHYSNNIYGYVRSIVSDDHEAEDVTQHVFAKLMISVGEYDPSRGSFAPWLLRLAHNVAVDHLRTNRTTPMASVLPVTVPVECDLDRAGAVRAALAALPDEQREVVVLRHIVGLTPGEIADRLGRSKSSVHSLHHRGRRALQRELQQLESAPFTRSASHPVAA
jgi:RNA polymerase sigma-70 factor, ECF subfamily